MSLKLTAASFLAGVKQSGLIDPPKLEALLDDIEKAGIDVTDSTAIAQAMVARNALTDWQSEKLLQGRHKGFILGRYKLLSLLGTGEMSAVYLAEHIMMERRCAIKVLPANKVQDTSYLGRFHREARAVASLNHPNIVKAYDVDKQLEGGTEIHFLVMEFVEGKNLGATVAELGPLSFDTAAEYIRQAAEGLQHAHHNGLVHRDIKPENLLIDQQGVIKLLDLGLARFFNKSDEESLTIKHDEKVLGTADYLAPEQAIDSHKVDHRADIYSLGCTLYYALTGHPPFTDGSLVQRLLAHQTRKPPSVKFDRPDVPEDLLAILEKMMAKKAADRYQTAADAAEALARWLITNGSDAWRSKHLMLVAALGGLSNSAGSATPASTSPALPAAPLTSGLASAGTAAVGATTAAATAVSAPVTAALAPAAVAAADAPVHASPVLSTAVPLIEPDLSEAAEAALPSLSTTAASDRKTPSPKSAKPVRTSTTPAPISRATEPQAVRRPRTTAPAQPLPQRWDWEKTLTIGLLSLGTVVVIMIGIWLFNANKPNTTVDQTPPDRTTQTTLRPEGPAPTPE